MNVLSPRIRPLLVALGLAGFLLAFAAPACSVRPAQYEDEPSYGPSSGQAADARHRGYQDGMVGALHDIDHRRRPAPADCGDFRKPKVASALVGAYRSGFRRGYNDALHELTGMPEHSGGREMMIRGYHDGAAGAVRDWKSRRPADPNNRGEYRRPAVPAEVSDVYRDAFRRGYARVASMIY